jgi:hypothetical protein
MVLRCECSTQRFIEAVRVGLRLCLVEVRSYELTAFAVLYGTPVVAHISPTFSLCLLEGWFSALLTTRLVSSASSTDLLCSVVLQHQDSGVIGRIA